MDSAPDASAGKVLAGPWALATWNSVSGSCSSPAQAGRSRERLWPAPPPPASQAPSSGAVAAWQIPARGGQQALRGSSPGAQASTHRTQGLWQLARQWPPGNSDPGKPLQLLRNQRAPPRVAHLFKAISDLQRGPEPEQRAMGPVTSFHCPKSGCLGGGWLSLIVGDQG